MPRSLRFITDYTKCRSSIQRADTLLIDFDGTIVDYHVSEELALQQIYADQDIDETDIPKAIEAYKAINERLWKEFEKQQFTMEQIRIKRFEELNKLYPVDLIPMKFNEHYILKFVELVTPYDGAVEAMRILKEETPYNVIVVTNGSEDVQRERIKRIGLTPYIDAMFTSEKIGKSKPHSLMFDVALNFAKSSYQKSWMIGDSMSSDITGAYNLGINSCLIAPNGTNIPASPTPDMISPTFVDFVNWVLEFEE